VRAPDLDAARHTHIGTARTHTHTQSCTCCILLSCLARVQEAFWSDDLTHACCFACQQEAWSGSAGARGRTTHNRLQADQNCTHTNFAMQFAAISSAIPSMTSNS
jgi:hypothetical protein